MGGDARESGFESQERVWLQDFHRIRPNRVPLLDGTEGLMATRIQGKKAPQEAWARYTKCFGGLQRWEWLRLTVATKTLYGAVLRSISPGLPPWKPPFSRPGDLPTQQPGEWKPGHQAKQPTGWEEANQLCGRLLSESLLSTQLLQWCCQIPATALLTQREKIQPHPL